MDRERGALESWSGEPVLLDKSFKVTDQLQLTKYKISFEEIVTYIFFCTYMD
jgi:hypothetical protein